MPAETDQEPEPTPATAPEPESQAPTPAPQPEPTDQDERLKALFGELCPLEQIVNLGPSMDRQRFRAQRDALKQLGYKFNFEHQLWKAQAAA